MNIVSEVEKKVDLRKELARDVKYFLAHGGKIYYAKRGEGASPKRYGKVSTTVVVKG